MEFTVVWIIIRYELSRPRVLGEYRQRVLQYFLLQRAHTRFAQAIPDLEAVWIQRARWSHLRRNLRTDRNQNRRYAPHLNFTLDRDDRAVTNAGSTAGQHNQICAGAFINFVGNLASGSFVHGLELHGVTHVAHVFLCHGANKAVSL